MPGHSKGSIALYNRQEGYSFVSDAVLKRTHMTHSNSQDLLDYAKTLERFISKVEEGITLYNGHQQDYVFPGGVTLQLAHDLKAACEEVAAGKTEHDTVREAFFKGEKRTITHISGRASLLYDPDLM